MAVASAGPYASLHLAPDRQPRQHPESNLDFTEATDSEWQWHQLGRIQVCTLLQKDNHASTPPLSFLQAGCLSCHLTNCVKAVKADFCNLSLLLKCYCRVFDKHCVFCCAAKSAGGRNLWSAHRLASLKGEQIRTIASGCMACHSVVITADGKVYSWGMSF